MCSYLHRAPNGRYYFRMAIPSKLRPAFGGKREIKQALDTADRDKAKLLIPDLTKTAQDRLADAQAKLAQSSLPPPQPKSQAQIDRERARWEFEQEQADWIARQFDEADSELEALSPIMDALADGRVVDAPMTDVVRAAQLALYEEREKAANKLDAVMFAHLSEGAGASEERDQAGKYGKPAFAHPSGKGLFLDTDVLNGWAMEREPGARSRAAYESAAKLFNDSIGRKSVELVTKSDVLAFRSVLGEQGRSQFNVWDKLGKVRTLFAWAAQNDLVASNPAGDVRARKGKGEKRKDFNIDDLNALFAGPVYTEGSRPTAGGGEAAFWLPLLALFMGARREELGQLRVVDVLKVPFMGRDEKRQEVWCLQITDAADDAEGLANQLKNAGSRRTIPLHPDLIELGFVEYVQGLEDQRGRIFPALKPVGVGQKLTDKWGQWFGRYKRECGITDKLKVFHSFRHTWKTYAVDAGIPERVCRQFQGHEGKDAADNYGAAPSMRVLVEAIRSYRIPGLQLTALKMASAS